MWHQPENDQFAGVIYTAGEQVPKGIYKRIGQGGREVEVVNDNDRLPASLDGCVATYVSVNMHRWEHSAHHVVASLPIPVGAAA